MQKIDLNEVAKNYNSNEPIWQPEDKWHSYNYRKINEFVKNVCQNNLYENKIILNAGSGGQSYNLPEDNMYHFDLVDLKIKDKKHYSIGSIESIPYENKFFDLVLCVGEVINYCDAFKSIKELTRVLKIGGELILEYESSKTLELLFTENFNASSVITNTFFQGRNEKLWYFSEDYINSILQEMDVEIQKRKRFHQLSILIYRMTKSPNFSVKFAKLDPLIQMIPWINSCASNVIILARKFR